MSPSRSRHNAAWLLPAALGLGTRKTPFHLVQFGAGSGLDLIADYEEREPLYSEEGELLPGPEEYRQSPFPILSRTGLDPEPQTAASELFRSLSREPSGPQIIRCGWDRMTAYAAERLVPKPFDGLFVFGKAPEPEMAKLLAPWGERGFWSELDGGALRVRRLIGNELKSAELARIDARDRFVLSKGWNFLQPTAPAAPERVTIEEPPRRRL